MDCKEAKEFLSQHGIKYIEYDLTRNPDREDEMKERTGSRIVPALVIKIKDFPVLLNAQDLYWF
ncbi:glutaredoxin family protein [Cytobacillus firmus]|uniref:glutaredoxin family protein n=1 Tax=Cytobacillus firmus TaxID=1399 RepID=UPI0039B6F4B3